MACLRDQRSKTGLFSVYVNDLLHNISKGNLYLFADNGTLYCIGDNIEEVIDCLNEAASRVNSWCNHNQLSIQLGKSEVLIFKSQQFTGPLRSVKIGTDTIRFVNKSTSLGITIKNHLKWDEQIKKVTKVFCWRMCYWPVNVQEEIYFINMHHCSRHIWNISMGNMFAQSNEWY